MTKEQMAERIADKLKINGLSRSTTVYMLTCLTVSEIQKVYAEYVGIDKMAADAAVISTDGSARG